MPKSAKKPIKIKKANKGKFTAKAKAAGMGVATYAKKVLANKSRYSSETVKQAAFAAGIAKSARKKGKNPRGRG